MAKTQTTVGKVSRVGGKYLVTVGRKKFTLPVGTLISKELISPAVGKEVEVVMFNKTIVGIGGLRPPITCYIPAFDLLEAVEPEVQAALRKVYTQAGILGD
jgi:hypothetical protein